MGFSQILYLYTLMVSRKPTGLWLGPLLLLLLPLLSSSQGFNNAYLDSLRQSLHTSNRKEHTQSLRRIGNYYGDLYPDSASYYLNLALHEAKLNGDTALTADCLLSLANYQYDRGELEKALDYAETCESYFSKVPDKKGVLDALNAQANAYSSMGMNNLAMNAYLKALHIAENLNDKVSRAVTLFNLGTIVEYGKNDSLALSYFHQAELIYRDLKQFDELGDIYNNYAEVYLNLGNYKKAKTFYYKALKNYKKYHSKRGLEVSELNIGHLELLQKQTDSVEYRLNKSEQLAIEIQDSVGLGYVWKNRAELALEEHNYDRAMFCIIKAEAISKVKGNADLTLNVLKLKSQIYEMRGDFKQAFIQFKIYSQFKDSLRNMSNQATLKAIQLTLQNEHKDAELNKLSLENEKRQSELRKKDIFRKVSIAFIGILLVVGMILIFVNRRQKHLNSILNEQQSILIEKNNRITSQQKELAEINKTLKNEKDLAEKANHAKDQFLSVISHELRTPLNAVIGFAKLLKQSKHLPSQLDNINGLESSAQILLALINNLLDISKLEEGAYIPEIQTFSLREVVNEVGQIFRASLDSKKLDYIVSIDKDLAVYFRGDATALRQIILNLLSNAIKFTDKGSIHLTITKTVLNKNITGINLEIRDTGIGIPEEEVGQIFDKFRQADSSIRRKYGGSGLGLAIIKNLLDRLGGTVDVSSKLNDGTTFSVKFPLEPVEKADVSGETILEHSADIRHQSVKILLAEDNEINIMVVNKFLQRWGYDADVANDGKEAVEMALKGNYQLILMDIQMPVMDGYEAAKAIKATRKDVRIVALTADLSPGVLNRVNESGMDDYLSKPFNPEKLLSLIEKSAE